MKVLQINSVCGYGSTGRIATDIHLFLRERGVESKIAFGRGDFRGVDAADVIRIGSKRGNYADALATRVFDRAGFHSRRATARFLAELDAYAPDVVHLHNLHGYYLHVGMLFDYLKAHPAIRVVWTLHDCWSFTGHCTGFDFQPCAGWRDGCKRCPQKRSYPSSYLFAPTARMYRRKRNVFCGVPRLVLATPSAWLAELVGQSFLRAYPVRVVPNGIDLSVFRPTESDFRAEHGLQNRKIVLGVAGVWGERRGLGDFLKLAAQADADTRVVLVGVDADTARRLPPNVMGIPRTASPEALAAIYSAADLYFNPTYEDNFPTTNLEALACGTPVVTYPTGGSAESIDADSGLVIAKGDVGAALRILNEHRFDREKVLRRGQAFDKNLAFCRYLDLYREEP